MPLAVTFPLSGRFGDFHPLERVRAGRTTTKAPGEIQGPVFFVGNNWQCPPSEQRPESMGRKWEKDFGHTIAILHDNSWQTPIHRPGVFYASAHRRPFSRQTDFDQ